MSPTRVVRLVLLVALAVIAGVYLRGCERFAIPASDQSMSPLYRGGSRVVCETLDPDEDLERGMDVVYAMEWEGTLRARFGRVRALPGDRVGVDGEGLLTVNGERIGPIGLRGEAAGVVPPGHVYILAINPQEQRYPDSRKLGFIARDAVRARIRAHWGFGS